MPTERYGSGNHNLKPPHKPRLFSSNQREKYLDVQILRRRKNKAVHPMVIERLSRLPRKLMPRILRGFTKKQTTVTISETSKASGIYQGFPVVISERGNFIQTSCVFQPKSSPMAIHLLTSSPGFSSWVRGRALVCAERVLSAQEAS